MDIQLLIADGSGKSAYMPSIAGTTELTQHLSAGAASLSFDVISDKNYEISEGSAVRLAVGGKKLFLGYIFSQSTRDDIKRVKCYDQLRYLLNKDTYVYENKTAAQLVKMIAEDYSLKTGILEDTDYVISFRVEENTSLLDMICNALDLTYENSGKRYRLYDKQGFLTLESVNYPNVGDSLLLIDGRSAEDFKFSSSVDKNVYNKIKLIFNDKKSGKREIYISKDSKNIENWGVLQYIASLKKGENGPYKSDKLLKLYNRKNNSLSLKNVYGDLSFGAGSYAFIKLDTKGFKKEGIMLAERVVHRFSADGHFMDIDFIE